MANDNTVVITGNLTDDPELRYTEAGLAVCRFSIAWNQSKKVGDEWESIGHFFDVTAFGDIADNIVESLSKGSRVTITGRLEQRRWEDKETGDARSKVAIVADDVAPSLRWATAAVTRNPKKEGGSNASGKGADDGFWDN